MIPSVTLYGYVGDNFLAMVRGATLNGETIATADTGMQAVNASMERFTLFRTERLCAMTGRQKI
ncbi:MAG: hypothetical protein ACLSD6_02100 [Clostridium sp.]